MDVGRDSRFWWYAIGATLAFAAVLLIAMFLATYHDPADSFRLEAAKLLLQFILVGVGGTLVLAYLNQRRDAAEKAAEDRRDATEHAEAEKVKAERIAAERRAVADALAAARRAALQELIRQIGDAHRRLKVVKRQMRALIRRDEEDPRGPPPRPYKVPAAAFERAIESLLNAQIASEEVRDRIQISVDLLKENEIARIRQALRYGSRYFHDVYEDFEHGRIKREGDEFVITSACNNLHNFLFAREPPGDLPEDKLMRLRALFQKMREEARGLPERYGALEEIETLRQSDPRKRRFRAIATECFSLAADELRGALWHTCGKDASPDGAASAGSSPSALGVAAVA